MKTWRSVLLLCSLAVACGGPMTGEPSEEETPGEAPPPGFDTADEAEPWQGEVSAEWNTPRTPLGTAFLVKDIFPPAEQPPGAGARGHRPLNLVSFQGKLYFTVNFQLTGESTLWTSDGTAPGTFALLRLPTGTGVFTGISQLTVAGGRLFFTVSTSTGSSELWASDGTASGTRRLREFTPAAGRSTLSGLAAVGDTLFFFHHVGPIGPEPVPTSGELWKSDGTPSGTVRVRSLGANAGGQSTPVGSRLFFTLGDAEHGTELWVSNGTAAGTRLVRDILPGPGSSEPFELTAVGDELFFTARDAEHGVELWKSDGTRTGTRLVADVAPGPGSSFPHLLGVLDERLYFTARAPGFDGLHLLKVKVEGSCRHRPVLVADIPSTFAGNPDVGGPYASVSTVTAGRIYFVIEYTLASLGGFPLEGQLWVTTGTRGETRQLTRSVFFSDSFALTRPTPVGDGRVLFTGRDEEHGAELWVSDGTVSGTRLQQDIVPGPGSSIPRDLTPADGFMFFVAFTPETGNELWALPLPGHGGSGSSAAGR